MVDFTITSAWYDSATLATVSEQLTLERVVQLSSFLIESLGQLPPARHLEREERPGFATTGVRYGIDRTTRRQLLTRKGIGQRALGDAGAALQVREGRASGFQPQPTQVSGEELDGVGV